MAREKEMYRDNLERVIAHFGNVELIPLNQVGDFLGCHYRTLQRQKDFPVKKVGSRVYVTVVALARWLS